MRKLSFLTLAAIAAAIALANGERIGKPLFVEDMTETNGILRVEFVKLDVHAADTQKHVTAADRAKWNGAVYDEQDPTVPAWAKAAFKPLYSWGEITAKPSLATVATSGLYSDLTGTPELAPVATSGRYVDLTGKPATWPWSAITGKPTIPTVPTVVSAFENDAGYLTEHQSLAAIEARLTALEGRAYIQIDGEDIYLIDPTEEDEE